MQLVKSLKKVSNRSLKLISLALFLMLFLGTRLPGLSHDNVNPDSINWHSRSEQFVNGLKFKQFEKTYQHYQPGVTLMWIVGPTVEILKQVYPEYSVYSMSSFPTFHHYSKVVLIFTQLVLTCIAFYSLEKLLDWKKALLILAAFTFEPFFLANSRVLHLDILLTLLLFNGLLLAFWQLKEFNLWKGIAAGVFFGLAFLTKSIGLGGFLFAAGVGGLYLLLKKDIKTAFLYSFSILIPAFLTIFILLPALWVDAADVITKIYDGIARVGIARGHNQIFFGESTRDGGIFFYPVLLVLKLSPFALLGWFLFAISTNIKKSFKSFGNIKSLDLVAYLFVFYLGYFVVMTIGSKKIDRYLLPMYPFLAMITVWGYYKFVSYIKVSWAKWLIAIVLICSVAVPAFRFYPYYFTYTNPLFGSPEFIHTNIIAQKPFGVAMFELADKIHTDFGYEAKISKLDPKPFFYLHDRDNIKFTRIDGTSSYDVLIVAVNEEFPEKALKSGWNFEYYDSIYVNGLEYWRIYERTTLKTKTN